MFDGIKTNTNQALEPIIVDLWSSLIDIDHFRSMSIIANQLSIIANQLSIKAPDCMSLVTDCTSLIRVCSGMLRIVSISI